MKMGLFASFLAAIIIASGMLGAFYFTGAQVSVAQLQRPLLAISPSVGISPGAAIHVTGTGFAPQSSVTISLAKVLSNASSQFGKAYVIQSPSGVIAHTTSTSTSSQAPPSGGLLDSALSALSSLFGGAIGSTNNITANQAANTTASNVTNSTNQSATFSDNSATATSPPAHTLLILQSRSTALKNVTLECQNQTVLKTAVSVSGVTVAEIPSGTQIDVSCTVTAMMSSGTNGQNATFGNATAPSAGLSLFNKVIRLSSDGGFSGQIRMPASASGEFAVLAQGSGDKNAFALVPLMSSASVSVPQVATPPVTVPTSNQTSVQNNTSESQTTSNASSSATSAAANQTATVTQQAPNNTSTQPTPTQPTSNSTSANSTSNPAPSVSSNSNSASSSNSTSSAKVQVSENELSAGAPVAISGSGFKPQVPVQVFINNVQITNIITNVEGSFDTVIIVPTTVNSGSANVVVKTEQTNISEPVTIVPPTSAGSSHTVVEFTSVIAGSGTQTLNGAPVTILDSSNGHLVMKGKTPLEIQDLQKGTYSVFYSDFGSYVFVSAAPGKWSDTNNGGAGILTVSGLKNITIIAMYQSRPTPPPAPSPVKSTLTLAAQDTAGNAMPGMFVTLYSADASQIVQQGFTTMKVTDLLPGTYPVFFADFGSAVFANASPGVWVQTPFGGAGLVTIPDDGQSHDITVTAIYQISQTTIQEQPAIQAPLDLSGTIYTITANTTQPSGPQILSGTFHLKATSDSPANASFSAYMVSANDDANPNVSLESQSSREHHTMQIVDLKPSAAGSVGPNSYLISGTADLLVDGNVYSNNEKVQVMVSGGDDLTPTNIQITFQGSGADSAASRIGTVYGAIDLGIK